MERHTLYLRSENEKRPVPIVADAAMASGLIGDGRLIPLVILDTSTRPDIDAMILAHDRFGPGDMGSIWCKSGLFDRDHIRLVLEPLKPVRCVIILEFDLPKQAGLVDQIVHTQALYLQAGRPGDRLSSTFDHPRIVTEIPCTDFLGRWNSIMRNALARDFRKRGLPKRRALSAAEDVMRQGRELGSIRFPPE